VQEGRTALLSAPGDVASYAANLKRMATDSVLRQRLGDAGRIFVARERSVETAARTLSAVIAEVR
jgi:glycosyltransferase involved in cell wall biosynthesis